MSMTYLFRLTQHPSKVIFILAILWHWVIIGSSFWAEAYPPESADEARYVFYGNSIRAGQGMHAPGYEDRPTAYVMPLLPLVIAASAPDSLVLLRLIQVVFTAGVAVLTFHLGSRIQDTRLGWLAAGLLMLNLGWVQQPLYILTEPLFTLLILLALYSLVIGPQNWRGWVGAGLGLGLAWLTRGALVGVIALLLPYLWWRQGWRAVVMVAAVMGLVILPWGVRNWLAMDRFTISSSQSGNVLAGAYNDTVYQNPWAESWINPDALYGQAAMQAGFFDDEWRYSDFLAEQGREWILANPDKLPKLVLAHAVGYSRPWFKVARNDLEWLYIILSWAIGSILTLYGAWLAWKQSHSAWGLLACLLLGGVITALVFYGSPRFRLPYAPYLALLQALAVWQFWKVRANNSASAI
jgi:4-amino-4-deoxy-L-arabinose transferase-like glycosyltransferase